MNGATWTALGLGAALGAAAVSACAGPRAAGPGDPLAAAFGAARARRAETEAPDLYARALRARTDAGRTRDPEARADAQQRARMLLDAAEAEADRIDAERARAAAEDRAAAAVERRALLERERIASESELAREQAGAAAERELASALAEVEPGRLPRDKRAREAAQMRAAELLCQRAELTLAAAGALGLPRESALAVEQTIAAAQAARGGGVRLDRARAALAAAERSLADTRRARAGQGDAAGRSQP